MSGQHIAETVSGYTKIRIECMRVSKVNLRKIFIPAGICLSIFTAGSAKAQILAGDIFIIAQGTASVADRSYSANFVSEGSFTTSQQRRTEFCVSVAPAFWLSTNGALEVECAYACAWTTWDSKTPAGDDIRNLDFERALAFIPHLLIAPGIIDSVVAPYFRFGVGIATHYTTPLAVRFGEDLSAEIVSTIFSAGAGVVYFPGTLVVLRGEINYRSHHAQSGHHDTITLDWSALNLFLGVGFRL